MTETLNDISERAHLALLRLLVLTLYRPLTRHVIRPLSRLTDRPRA